MVMVVVVLLLLVVVVILEINRTGCCDLDHRYPCSHLVDDALDPPPLARRVGCAIEQQRQDTAAGLVRQREVRHPPHTHMILIAR